MVLISRMTNTQRLIKKRLIERRRYKRHRHKILRQKKEHRLRCKLIVINAYGGKCVCCDESNVIFLSVEHKNGNGNKHRRYIHNIWAWLIKRNFPKSFTILCHNCNLGSYLNGGICPHKSIADKL